MNVGFDSRVGLVVSNVVKNAWMPGFLEIGLSSRCHLHIANDDPVVSRLVDQEIAADLHESSIPIEM